MEEHLETDDGQCDEDKDGSNGLSSLGLSLSSSQDLHRPMRPPNKKKYEEEMEELQKLIRIKDIEIKALGVITLDSIVAQLQDIKAEKEACINKRKKIDSDLRLLNQEITNKMGQLSRTESNLHYKNEAKIDDTISKMEWQLKTQNFRLAEERRIVAEVDKLKRSKKVLQEYFAQKKEVDKIRDSQRSMRLEKEQHYKTVTTLARKEEELKRSIHEKKFKAEELKKELDQFYERKRQLFVDFKQSENDYQKHLADRRQKIRKESFKKKEEERKAKEEAWQKEMLEFESQREPFEDEKNLCNTLINYLQRFMTSERDEPTLASPREERPEHLIGPADSLDDGMFVLLKKSEDPEVDYSVTNKQRRRSKKGRKLSVTKPLAHIPQIISQFSSLNLNAPSNVSEVAISIEQLQARKQYYDDQCIGLSIPLLGKLCGSFSSSGSFSSLESPLRERSSTWGFVPSVIAENQTPSDAGTSAESGFHDMSRQASKTESSESATDNSPGEQVFEEMIKQSADYMESEASHSSNDTITLEDHAGEEVEQSKSSDLATCSKTSNLESQENISDSHSIHSHDNGSLKISAFEECCAKVSSTSAEETKGDSQVGEHLSANILNYDTDFPPAFSTDSIGMSVCESVKWDQGTSSVCQIHIPKWSILSGDNNAGCEADNVRSEIENVGNECDNVGSDCDNVGNKCDNVRNKCDNVGSEIDNTGMVRTENDTTFTSSEVVVSDESGNIKLELDSSVISEDTTQALVRPLADIKSEGYFNERNEVTHL